MSRETREHDSIDETLAAGLPSAGAGPGGGELLAGRYELLSMLGRGGMGSVYRVRDRELDELVALKMLHHDLLASDGMLERFRQEVKLARRVTHKNVARTFDIGQHRGDRFLTMELVEGEPLSSRLERNGAMELGEALRVARQMCAGMAAAHEAGVIHRDLKPENVCIATGGRVVLMDFGIARAHLPGDARQTSGQMLGTPYYMAPEQVRASDAIDARADLYAFGAVLFEMLTGQVAWPGESAIVIAAARLYQPPPDPRDRRPELPAAVAALVLRCMALEPDARFASARALEAALDAIAAAPSPTLAPDPLPPPRYVGPEAAVAVLPFRNVGPVEDAYFAEGLTEDLVDALSTTEGLRVRARAGEVDAGAAPDAIGRRLGVDVVVEGSVRKIGGALRVSARLVGVQDGFQIWAARFERPIEAALSLNDEVARAIAAALCRERRGPDRPPVGDATALELFFRARHALSQYWVVAGAQEEPLAMLRAALDRAPDDPTILTGYVLVRAGHSFLKSGGDAELESLAVRALERMPHLGEPWLALASVRHRLRDDPAGALRALRRAMVNAPSLANAHDLAGRILLEAGAIDEALALLERALWLDPLLPWARVDRMRISALRGDLAGMEEWSIGAPGDPQWSVQRQLGLDRYHLWWRTPLGPDTESLLPSTADARVRGLDEIVRRSRAGAPLRDEDRAFFAGFVDSVPPASRARRLFCQLAAEIFAFAREDAEARRFVAMSVEAGLGDLPWIDLNPLLAPLRAADGWDALREPVAERARAVVAAWREPPETLGGANTD